MTDRPNEDNYFKINIELIEFKRLDTELKQRVVYSTMYSLSRFSDEDNLKNLKEGIEGKYLTYKHYIDNDLSSIRDKKTDQKNADILEVQEFYVYLNSYEFKCKWQKLFSIMNEVELNSLKKNNEFLIKLFEEKDE